MNLLEAIFHSALAQRLAQNTQATQQGQLAGRDVGDIPVLGGILTSGGQGNGLSPLNFLNTAGMVNEGAANLAKALTGLGLAGTGAVAQSPLLPATQEHRAEGAAALAAFQQPGNPYERALAANEAGAQGHGFAVGLVNAALNPLNYVGPAGDAGTALRTAQEAGPLARALGGALEAGSLTGHAAMLPYQAGFGALGYGVKGVGRGLLGALRGGVPEAAQAAAPAVATAIDNAIAPAVADQAATAAAPGFGKATMDLLAAEGIDPAKLAGLDADMAHYVATNAGPGQEDGLIAALRGEAPPATGAATSPVAEAVRALNPAPAAPEIAPPSLGTAQALDRTIPPALASGLNPQDFATMPPAAPGQAKIATGRARTMFEQLMQDLGPTDSAEGFRRKLGVALQYLSDRGYNPMSEAEDNRLPFARGPVLQPDEAARLLAGGSAPQAAESGITQFLDQLPGRGAVSRTLTDIPALPEVTPPAGPTWTHYGPESIYPGEGVTPEILDQFAKLRQFPNPSPLDVNAEIGAMRDPVALLQQHYGNDWRNRLTALTGGKWGQPDSGAQLVNGRIMLGGLDLTTAVRDYLENRGGAQAGDFKGALKALLPEQGLPTPVAPAPLAQPTGTLDDVRRLIQGESQRVGTQYPPLDAKFYAARANVDPAQVPAMLDQLVSEGTLGRLPDGSLALKPPTAPADRAAWQAKYVGQSQAGTDILAQGDKVGGSDLTQADLNALSPQERMAALRKLAGGDIAAGGGGGGFGLLPARVGSTLAGAAGGGLLGAGLGAATHPQDRGRGAVGGGLLGAAAGGNLGSVAPELGAALPVARSIGADMAASMRQAAATGEQSILPGGGKAGKDRFAASTSYLRQARKTGLFTIARNLSDDAAKLAMAGENPLRYAADVAHMVGQSPTALPAIRGAAGDTEQIAMARYAQLPDRYRQQFSPGMFQKLLKSIGTDYANDPTDLGSANVHPGYGAIRGGLMSLLSPKVLVTGPVTPLLGAAEMASLPARVAAQQAVLGPADIAARLLPAADPAARDLAAAAPAFIRKVAASGQSVALLPRSGAFDASLIKDPALAAEWDAIQQAAADKAGAVSKDILGNFATDSGARKVLNTLFPGAVWNIGQAQVLARAAARHPQAALAALNLMREDYQRHLAEGDPEHAGTYRLTDKTPGLGLLARIANGGAAGNYDVPLTYSFSPFGGETLNLPRQLDPYLNPGQSLYDKGKTVGAALGASDNPLLDMLAYRTGMASQPHVDPMRSAPIGQFADQMLAAKGALPLAANPLATALTPEGAQQDVGTALRLGRYLDPAALRAGAEIVQEQTGKPLIDRANIDYVAQLHDPTSPLYQQALARGLGGRAATAVAGEFIPGGPQATTATQAAVDQAQMGLQRQGLPVTRAQIAMLQSDPEGARAILGAQFQARVDQAKASNPLLATYDAANPGMLATLLMGQWARDNALLGFFPGILDFQRNIEAEKLGLLPPGTLAQKQQTMDLVNQGILPGLPQVAPGVPMQISPQGADAVRSLNQVRR